MDTTQLQEATQSWLHRCTGESAVNSARERNQRFIEEALELVQATGCSKDEVLKLVDHVFSRDPGEPGQEVGGVMLTLASLCTHNGLDMGQCAKLELERIDTPEMIEHLRVKSKNKQRF